MKPVLNQLKRGFTLIELMIVVAIIGLLAALAIPNFIRFQARARQAEARTNLKAVYTAEKSYYGDKQMYFDLFDVIGFAPEFNNRYSYFGGAGAGVETRAAPVVRAPAVSVSCAAGAMNGITQITSDRVKWGVPAPAYAAPAVVGTVANLGGPAAVVAVGVFPAGCCPQGQCEFAAGATGNIDNDTTYDQWFIASQGSAAGGAAQACQVGAPSGNTGTYAEGEAVNVCNDVNF